MKGKELGLVCLSTSNLATPEGDLFWVEAFVEKIYKTFCNVRLESDPPKLKFYDKIANRKAKSLSVGLTDFQGNEDRTHFFVSENLHHS